MHASVAPQLRRCKPSRYLRALRGSVWIHHSSAHRGAQVPPRRTPNFRVPLVPSRLRFFATYRPLQLSGRGSCRLRRLHPSLIQRIELPPIVRLRLPIPSKSPQAAQEGMLHEVAERFFFPSPCARRAFARSSSSNTSSSVMPRRLYSWLNRKPNNAASVGNPFSRIAFLAFSHCT